MAMYHCSVKIIKRSDGRSATGAAAYRAGMEIEDERTGEIHDYTKKKGVDHLEIMSPINSPGWVNDRATLWNTVEQTEKRKDAQLCREVEVSLPVELDFEEQKQLIQKFCREQFVAKGMIADIAMHDTNSHNPHAHILLTMRDITKDGFGKKKRDWNEKKYLKEWRQNWANHANRYLVFCSEQIDHRSLADQGIDRIPQIHMGAQAMKMEAKGIRTDRGDILAKIGKTNQQINLLKTYRDEAINHELAYQTNAIARDNNGRTGEPDRATGGEYRLLDRGINNLNQGNADGIKTDTNRLYDTNNAGSGETENPNRTGKRAELRDSKSRQEAPQLDNQEAGESNERGRDSGTGYTEIYGQSAETNAELESLLRDAGRFVDDGNSATGRIIDMGQRKCTNDQTGDGLPSNATEQPLDRTYLAVRQQIDAIGADTYDIGITRNEKTEWYTWDAEEVLDNVAWLKRKNALGADIQLRPSDTDNQAFVMLEDVKADTINKIKDCGYAPAAVVESRPGNYQAWIKLTAEPINKEERTEAKGILSKDYATTTADHGMLSGFKHRDHKVICTEATGEQSAEGESLIARIRRYFATRKAEREEEKRIEATRRHTGGDFGRDPVMIYKNEYKRLVGKGNSDPSSIDYAIAKTLALAKFGKDTIVKTLEDRSPEQPARKLSGDLRYCNDIADKAIASREVSAASISDRAREWKARNQKQTQRSTPSPTKFGM